MLSCLPESCWSACLTLVVSGSLCAELITGYDKSTANQIGLLDRHRFWGGGGNYYTFIDFFFYCYSVILFDLVMERASKIKNIDCLRLGWGG